MKIPTIHLNGTSREELLREARDAHQALSQAFMLLCRMTVHGRDYYTQEPGAFEVARAEHVERVRRVADVIQELERYAVAIQEEPRDGQKDS